MYCRNCGIEVRPEQIFCSKCGQRVGAGAAGENSPPAVTAQPATYESSAPGASAAGSSRVARNVNTLGILWIVYSLLRMLPGLALLGLSHLHLPVLMGSFPFSRLPFGGPFLGAIGLLISGTAIAGVIAGWGLMSHRSWARLLAIILACLNLIHIPLGTALAIYTFWVLLAGGAEAEYENLARAH